LFFNANFQTAPYFTNASVVKANGVLRGYFTRTVAPPNANAVRLNINGMNFMTACSASGAFPTVHRLGQSVFID